MLAIAACCLILFSKASVLQSQHYNERFTCYHESLHSISHGANCLRKLGGRLDLGFCGSAVAPLGHTVGHLPWQFHGQGIWSSRTHRL